MPSELSRYTLLPTDPTIRGLCYQWLGWQAIELNPQWLYAVRALIRHEPGFEDRDKIDQSIAKWTRKMDLLESHLQGCDAFVTGADFTIADIALALSLHRWFALPRVPKAMPAVEAYYDRAKARPAAAPWMTTRTP